MRRLAPQEREPVGGGALRRSRLALAAAVVFAVMPATARADVPQAIDLHVTSDPGDLVAWTAAVTDPTTIDATLGAKGNGIVVTVPDAVGSAILQLRPPAAQTLHTGTYLTAANGAGAGAAPGLIGVRTATPNTCPSATGSFTVAALDLIGSAIGRARISFEFHCNGGPTAVRGTLRILAGLVEGTPDEGDTF